jgi:hypothetical protein
MKKARAAHAAVTCVTVSAGSVACPSASVRSEPSHGVAPPAMKQSIFAAANL